MIDREECVTEAAKYEALALEAHDTATRQALQRIARHWRDLADGRKGGGPTDRE